MRWLLLAGLLFLSLPSFADERFTGKVYFADGRMCGRCVITQNDQGFIVSIKRKGSEWLTEEPVVVRIDKHPLLTRSTYMYYGDRELFEAVARLEKKEVPKK